MFSINIYVKFALIALLLGGGLILAFAISFWYAFPLILAGLCLLASYILLGTVQSSAELVQEMKFEEAEKRLALTIKPEWLYKTNKAFFYIIKGNLALNRQDDDEAETWFVKAKDMELNTDDEKAMVGLQLANIYAKKNKWNVAKAHFTEVKKLKVSQPQLREQIKQFEKAFNQRGQMKHMRQGGHKNGNMQMRGRGSSKRRRPRTR